MSRLARWLIPTPSCSYRRGMQPVRRTADSTAAWEIARPSRMTALPGVDMAGFRIRGGSPIDLRAIPHPAITVAVEFGGRPFDIHGAVGRMRSESVTAGLAFSAFEVHAEDLECVQIRLSPLVARPVLGLPLAELRGSVIALDDLWGRAAPAGAASPCADLAGALRADRHGTDDPVPCGPGGRSRSGLGLEPDRRQPRTGPRERPRRPDRVEPAAHVVTLRRPDRPDAQTRRHAGPFRSRRSPPGPGATPVQVAVDGGYADQSTSTTTSARSPGPPPPPPRTSRGWPPMTGPGRRAAARSIRSAEPPVS